VLSREASAEAGKYRTDRAPYQRGILEACSDPLVEQVVVMSSAQVGKTEIELNVVGFYIDQDPAPILVVLPTVDPDAKAWSVDRLAPMLRDTPRLRGKVRDPRSRDSGNKILHKTFPGGHITLVGANSPSGLASRPIRVALFDEVDRFPASAGTEGDPVNLGVKRTSTFWNRKIVKVSTPTFKDFSRIEADWKLSDQRFFEVPCPHCGARQRLEWKHLHWETGKPASAAYACEKCGAIIDEVHKPRMLAGGRWVPTNPGSRIAGFHLNALYSPWARWGELARDFLEAKGSPERLRVFVNTVLGEPWEERGEQIEVTALAGRRERWTGDVPAGAGVLTAGVDIQGDRLELVVYGWGAGEEAWTVAHHRIYGDPEQSDVWERLETLRTKAYRHESGVDLRIRACGIDSGAFTHAVYRYVRPRQRQGVHALKGQSTRGRALLGRPSAKANRQGVRIWPVGVDTAKDVLFARLRMQAPGPGYIHFGPPGPDGGDDEYLAQFGAEKVVARFVKGVRIREYRPLRDRNEAIDLYVYALAALYSLGRGVVDHLGQLAARLGPAPGAVQTSAEAPRSLAEPPPAPPRGRSRPRGSGGWLHSWR
jgi:phage terminase large subunit GpA-like protein